MTDLEMTKLCAEAMGYRITTAYEEDFERGSGIWCHLPAQHGEWYRPLSGDLYGNAQAMALVKKFPVTIEPPALHLDGCWHVESAEIINGICPDVYDKDLNRSIVECVAKMQEGRHD